MLEGLTNVLEILANKVSRKAVIVALAMVLIYMVAATPNVASVLLFVGAIAGLAIFFTLLQWILDMAGGEKKNTTNKSMVVNKEVEEESVEVEEKSIEVEEKSA